MPEARLVAKLLATSAVTAIVGTRIHPAPLPQTYSLPALSYARASVTPDSGSLGDTDSYSAHIDLNCIAESYSDAVALSEIVIAAINGWRDLTGTPKVNMTKVPASSSEAGSSNDGESISAWYAIVLDVYMEYYSS